MRYLRTFAVFTLLLVGLAAGCKSKQTGAQDASKPSEGAPPASASGEDGAKADAGAKPGSSQTAIPADQTMAGATDHGHFYVVATPKPNPIPFQQLFGLDVKVYKSAQKKQLAKGVSLDQVRAVMPAHGHGMKTQPKITDHGDGTFAVQGMKFHMQGEGKDGHWVVEMVLNQDGTIDQAKFDVQCCRE